METKSNIIQNDSNGCHMDNRIRNFEKLQKAAEELIYQKCLVQGRCGMPMDEYCSRTGCAYHALRSAFLASIKKEDSIEEEN